MLYILPSWYTHAVPILGIAIILISMFLKVIPFISTYYLPLRIIGLVILLFGIFFEGVMFSGKELHDKIKEKAVYKPFSALNYTKNIATAMRKLY